MKDPSEMPVITETLFMQLNASVEFCPVMKAEDLQKGLRELLMLTNDPVPTLSA